MNLALNNLQRLICHKTQTNQTKPKVNISRWVELELVNFKAVAQNFSHNVMETPLTREFIEFKLITW